MIEQYRLSEPKARNLVVICKGPDALTLPRQPSWDLLEIYYNAKHVEDVRLAPSNADHIIFETDRSVRKYAIVKRLFDAWPDWMKYDLFFLLDDDIEPEGCTIEDILELFAKTNARIGQPALTEPSFWGHWITRQNDSYEWRATNFVEIMCPILTRDAMKEYMPLFDETFSSHGLDVLWSSREVLYGTPPVVLDKCPINHMRPIGVGDAYKNVAAPIDDESKNFMHKYSVRLEQFGVFEKRSKRRE